jgi:hypothetical protein
MKAEGSTWREAAKAIGSRVKRATMSRARRSACCSFGGAGGAGGVTTSDAVGSASILTPWSLEDGDGCPRTNDERAERRVPSPCTTAAVSGEDRSGGG